MSLAAAFLLFLAPQGLPPMFEPAENPVTAEKVLLGKALFWDEQLSSTNTVACGTCHVPSAGSVDPRTGLAPLESTHPGPDGIFGTADDKLGSRGIPWTLRDGAYQYEPTFGLGEQVTRRRSMPTINAGYFPRLFWDGRAPTTFEDPRTGQVVSSFEAALESQALVPLLSPVEMGHAGRTWDDVVERLRTVEPLRLAENLPLKLELHVAGRTYGELFAQAFPGDPDPVNPVRLAQAIASYERTLVSDDTPFDRWLGGDLTAFTVEEKRGHAVFQGPAACNFCHFGAFTTDLSFHNVGVRPVAEDGGRMEDTGFLSDRGLFKTPGLRNLALRDRFFHNGQYSTIAEVVDFYVRGGDFTDNLDSNVVPLVLTAQERADLIAFLTTGLLDQRVVAEAPPFDRPTLFRESTTRTPRTFDHGTPGFGGEVPRLVALEPAFRGNGSFALGLTHGAAGLATFLGVDVARGPVGGTPLFGAAIHLALSPAFSLQPTGALEPDGRGGGWRSLVCPIPKDPILVGSSLFGQWYVLDPHAPGGLAASEGLEVPVF